MRALWAHFCADAGGRCHDGTTGTTSEQNVVAITRQPKEQLQMMHSSMEHTECITLVVQSQRSVPTLLQAHCCLGAWLPAILALITLP